MPRLLALVLATALAAALPLQSLVSQTVTTLYAGTTVEKPLQTYRPERSRSDVANRRFDVFAFQVDASGNYQFINSQVLPTNWDHMFHLYSDCFDPLSPLTNLVAWGDFAPIRLSAALLSGRTYVGVNTGWSAAEGSYSLAITGPSLASRVECSSCQVDDPGSDPGDDPVGEPPVTSVPEPGSGILLLSAAGILGLHRLRHPRRTSRSR